MPFETNGFASSQVSPANLKLWVVEMDQNTETVGKVIGIESRRKQSRLRRRARRARIRASTRVRSTVRKVAREISLSRR